MGTLYIYTVILSNMFMQLHVCNEYTCIYSKVDCDSCTLVPFIHILFDAQSGHSRSVVI